MIRQKGHVGKLWHSRVMPARFTSLLVLVLIFPRFLYTHLCGLRCLVIIPFTQRKHCAVSSYCLCSLLNLMFFKKFICLYKHVGMCHGAHMKIREQLVKISSLWGKILLFKKERSTKLTFQFNIYAPNRRAPTFVKETVLWRKSHIDPRMLRVGDFTAQLSPLSRSPRWKLTRETLELTDYKPNEPNQCLQMILYKIEIVSLLLSTAWNFAPNC